MSRISLTAIFGCAVFFLFTTSALATAPAAGALTRVLTLSDLGLSEHVSLSNRNFEQHFYFPVPQGATLNSSNFEIHGIYQHPFRGTTAMTLLVNGRPVYTHLLPDVGSTPVFAETGMDGMTYSIRHLDGNGDEIAISLPLHGLHTQDGFLDLGVVLSSQIDATHCIDERGRGNELSINPKTTQLVYSFDIDSVRDIRSLLTTLPHRPVILLPQKKLNTVQYATTLRLSQALSSIGLHPEFIAVPQVGDVVNTASLSAAEVAPIPVPPEMANAIRQGKPYKISQPNEAGIWLVLRMLSSNGLAQAVIDPVQTRKALLDALQGLAPPAMDEQLWHRLELDKAGDWLANALLDKSNIRMSLLAGQPVLALEGYDMGKGIDLISTTWRQIATSRELALAASQHMPDRDSPVPHIHFAPNLPVQNVAGSAEWVVPIRLNQLPDGKWPDSFEINLMATPSGDGMSPVVSVFMNDNLLTALSLRTDGEITRLRARIPLYSLRMNNLLRVEIRRRNLGGQCSGAIQSFPVQLLPSSFMNLRDASQATQFFMLGTKFSTDSEVAIPPRYLEDAVNTLPVVDSILRGLSTGETDFKLVTDVKPGFRPSHTFVSFEIAPESDTQQVTAGNGRLVIRNQAADKTIFDSSGLGNLAVLQLVHSGKQEGINVITVNGVLPALRQPIALSTGNLAVADADGVKLSISLGNPEDDWQLDEQNRSPRAFIWRYRMWFVLLGLIMLPVTAIFGMRWYYRNFRNKEK